MNQNKYEDMLYQKVPTSLKHPRMSLYDRAAQFSPFAALTGHEEAIVEMGRLTDEKLVLSEQKKDELDYRLSQLCEVIEQKPLIQVTYFVPDIKKTGGKYVVKTGRLYKVDDQEFCIRLEPDLCISIEDIYEIQMSDENPLEA